MQRYKIDNSDIDNNNKGINFELGVGQDFALNLYQNEGISTSYIDRVKEENVNGIVDYEKHIFYPAYFTQPLGFMDDEWLKEGNTITLQERISQGKRQAETIDIKKAISAPDTIYDIDNYCEDVNSITFNLFLREREFDDTGTTTYTDWETSDTLYWNRWDGTKKQNGDHDMSGKDKKSTSCGDLLGYLGFTDNDVFYQKNALKKSFLRISVYDTPYRQNQKLLYYSTLFFDTNRLYKKYTNLIGNTTGVLTGDTNLVFYTGATDNQCLTASFKCTSKYDETACSDGFYMYLFNTIVKDGTCTPLYLKVEFNNAKYGKTIPLICPRFKTDRTGSAVNNTIGIDDKKFPEDYNKDIIDTEGNPVSYIDMQTLSDDLYIPILVRYNNVKNRFEWYVASNDEKEQTKDIVFNLYEPRINKLKEAGGGVGILPPEYQQVEYIEATDSASYINPNIQINADSIIEAKFLVLGKSSNGVHTDICGYSGSNGNFLIRYEARSTYYNVARTYGSQIRHGLYLNLALNQIYEIKINNGNGDCYLNGVNVGAIPRDARNIPTANCFIMATYGLANGQPYAAGKQRIYDYFRIYSNSNVIAREMYPCYRKADNEPGMYDIINNVFYMNAGTGTLNVGPDVN